MTSPSSHIHMWAELEPSATAGQVSEAVAAGRGYGLQVVGWRDGMHARAQRTTPGLHLTITGPSVVVRSWCGLQLATGLARSAGVLCHGLSGPGTAVPGLLDEVERARVELELLSAARAYLDTVAAEVLDDL